MDGKFGLKAAADRWIALGKIGDTLMFESEHIHMWEVWLEPG